MRNRQSGFATWHIPGRSPLIVYSTSILLDIASRGPVTGVLFGTSDEDEVRVTAFRPAADEAWLRRLMEGHAPDPSLLGLLPVGWCVSRAGSTVSLSGEDVQVWNRYFPQLWQIALVIRPHNGAAEAGFFFRPSVGLPKTDASEMTFEIGRAPVPPAPVTPPPQLFASYDQPRRSRRRVWALAGSLFLVAALGATAWHFGSRLQPVPARPKLHLRLVEKGDSLRAEWDNSQAMVREVRAADLSIINGTISQTVRLTPAQFSNGYWTITRLTEDVSARLAVERSGIPEHRTVSETARFVGSLPHRSQPLRDTPRLAGLRKDVADLEQRFARAAQENDTLAAQIRTLAEEQPTQLAPVVPPPVKEPVKQAEAPATPKPILPAPVFSDRAGFRPPMNRAEARTNAGAGQQSYSGPRSGQLTWTGSLSPNEILTIDGQRPSVGIVNGALPGVPVRLNIYGANGSGARQPLDVRLIYAPTPTTGYRLIQLRAGERPLTAIVIAWEAVPANP